MRVEHTPNSGWPGRPRNIGLDLARGEFVYFVDNDDWLGRQALERLHGAAERHESDIVIGKVVGHGRLVPRALFIRNRRETPLDWQPLLGLLTPHKLFRKSLLDEHGIRFPEGRRRLEDHLFVVHAYFHARRISVVASYPCYHWMRSPGDVNAAWRQFDPADYFDNVREVLDLVDGHTEPGPVRSGMYAQWYRGKMLGRVGGPPVPATRAGVPPPALRGDPAPRAGAVRARDRRRPAIQPACPVTAAARGPLRGARSARPVRVAAASRRQGPAGERRAR